MASPIAALGLSLGLLAGCGNPVVNPVTRQAERSVMDERAEIAAGQEGHRWMAGVGRVQGFVGDCQRKNIG